MRNIHKFIKLYKNMYRSKQPLSRKTVFACFLDNPEIHHAYNCYCKIDQSRKYSIPTHVPTKSVNGTLLFENRCLPHLEYLIRSAIYRLPSDWGHTIICTDSNVNYITLMTENITKGINILNLGNVNIDQNVYNDLLLSKEFWNDIPYEKVLVYQQDADIYHGNIQDFLRYDYVGAPWSDIQNDNDNLVGNGGFALRTTSAMISCLNHIHPGKLKLNSSTIEYMEGKSYLGSPLTYPPEDVYYSKTMIDYNLGKVADRETAKLFSNETYYDKNALGSHQHWRHNKSHLYEKIKNCYLKDSSWVDGEAQHHVSGWPGVINYAEKQGVVTRTKVKDNQIMLIDNLEKYFVWENNDVLETPWIGITHCTPDAPPYLTVVDISTLICNSNFQRSLKTCKCIVTLTKFMQQYFYRYVKRTPIVNLYHPTNDVKQVDKFNQENYSCIKHKLETDPSSVSIIQLGQQLRYMTSIYQLSLPYKKIWLTGTSDLNKMKSLVTKEAEWLDIQIDINSVDMTYIKDKETYKTIVVNNIVIIDLINASANNALLELTRMEVPFFIKKLPGVIEYLGYDYPLYFESLDELESILTDIDRLIELLEKGTCYLNKLDKSNISHSLFTEELLRLCNL